MPDPSRVAQVFTELVGALVGEFSLAEYMAQLISRVDELLPVRATGLLMADGQGDLRLMAVTQAAAHELETLQVEVLQGPCFDCFRTGRQILNADLGSASQWPRFARRAADLGYHTVHAFPLRLDGQVIGAMNLFAVGTDRLSDEQARLTQALADFAAIAVIHRRVRDQSNELTRQLQGALDSRVVLEQAKGVVAQRRGTSVDEAFSWLRDRARRTQMRLDDLAARVVSDPTFIDELAQPGPPTPADVRSTDDDSGRVGRAGHVGRRTPCPAR